MLGKLTRWLRMLGHNVKYANHLDDKTLVEIAESEKRVLLTRDVELYQKATGQHIKAFLVEGENEAERLATMKKRFNISLEFNPDDSRCPKCNTKIRRTHKDLIVDKIPTTTQTVYQEFWECPKCEKIYWQGAHWKRITETLEKAKQISAN